MSNSQTGVTGLLHILWAWRSALGPGLRLPTSGLEQTIILKPTQIRSEALFLHYNAPCELNTTHIQAPV